MHPRALHHIRSPHIGLRPTPFFPWKQPLAVSSSPQVGSQERAQSLRCGPSAPLGGSAAYCPGCHRSGRGRERVTGEEGGQPLGHAPGILHL
jgi:hypothetical protein